jgi:uncharacterized iron-regulated membrane protein
MSARPLDRRRTLLYRALFNVHLYAGLVIGLAIVIVGLSGSVIVYWREIDEMMNPDLLTTAGADPLDVLDTSVATLRQTYPENTGAWRIRMPRHERGVIVCEYYDPPQRRGVFGSASYVLIDPHDGSIRSTWYWNETLISWIYTLHMYLQAGAVGHDLVGCTGIVLLFMTLSGIYLWWPRRFNRMAFLMSLRSDWPRIEYDSHRLLGLYSLLVMFIVTVTGINIIYPKAVGALVGIFSPVEPLPSGLRSVPIAGRPPLAPSAAARLALQAFPDARLQTLVTPAGEEGIYRAILRQPMEVYNRHVAQTQIWLDQYSGHTLHVRDPRRFNAGTTLHSLTYGLHNGEAFGEFGKFLVFLTGPVLLWMYVTGVTRWLRRRRINSNVAPGDADPVGTGF